MFDLGELFNGSKHILNAPGLPPRRSRANTGTSARNEGRGLRMAQAITLDTAYLRAQDPDQYASLVIGAVAIVDGGVPDYALLKQLLAERIQSIPRCTQVLRTQSFEWIDCPGFDLAHHVRWVAIPRPGDDAQLSGAIAHALERPLDLDRPPWECWVIEGLKGGRWAILMKIHHGLADGNSAAHLLTRLCDDADHDAFANGVGDKHDSPPQASKRGWPLEWAGALAGNFVGAIWPTARPRSTRSCGATARCASRLPTSSACAANSV